MGFGMKMKPKILFADRRPMSEAPMELLQSVGVVVWASGDIEQELIRDMKDASIVISGLRKITRNAIFAAEKLKGIIVYGVGYDHVDVAAATEKGVYVVNTPGVNTISVAEFAFGLMIGAARKIPQLNANVKAGKWVRWELIGNELYGKVLGVIGLGQVGARIAALGRAFGMEVISYTRHPSKEREEKWGVKFVNLETLLGNSDFVVICCALTDETRGLIGEKELKLMKPTAYLINVARGPIIDERALVKALSEQRIAGAAIDVLEKEPPDPSSPLLKMENVIITSHMAGLSKEALERIQMTVAEEAVRILKGETPRYLVNKELLATYPKRDLE